LVETKNEAEREEIRESGWHELISLKINLVAPMTFHFVFCDDLITHFINPNACQTHFDFHVFGHELALTMFQFFLGGTRMDRFWPGILEKCLTPKYIPLIP